MRSLYTKALLHSNFNTAARRETVKFYQASKYDLPELPQLMEFCKSVYKIEKDYDNQTAGHNTLDNLYSLLEKYDTLMEKSFFLRRELPSFGADLAHDEELLNEIWSEVYDVVKAVLETYFHALSKSELDYNILKYLEKRFNVQEAADEEEDDDNGSFRDAKWDDYKNRYDELDNIYKRKLGNR